MALNRRQQDLIDKFEKMGVPPPVNAIIVNSDEGINDFDDTRAKINKRRNGALKEQYKTFIKNPGEEKIAPKEEMRKPAQNNRNVMSENKKQFTPPPLNEYRAEGNIMLKEVERLDSEPQSKPEGRYDILRRQLEEKAKREGASQLAEQNYNKNEYIANENASPTTIPNMPSVVYLPMNLNDANLQNLISEMATNIAKKVCVGMIKKVLSESEKNGITIINESDKIKKAEFVEKNIVKIAGKTYKITPLV